MEERGEKSWNGQGGGGAFVLFYLLFLVILGLPIMSMEFAVGRASHKSPVRAYQALEKPGQKWHIHGYFTLIGCYLLMMFYTTVAGWMMHYFYMTAAGKLSGLTADEVASAFTEMLASPGIMAFWMVVVVVFGIFVCARGLQNGLERVTKVMMIALLAIMVILAVNSLFMPGAAEGLKFYLVPDFARMKEVGVVNTLVGAMNQAFFTLSLGVGAMAIFGSYIGKERALLGESVRVVVLDTFVAGRPHHFPGLLYLWRGPDLRPQPHFYHPAQHFCQHGHGPAVGQPVLPVHGVYRSLHGAGRV